MFKRIHSNRDPEDTLWKALHQEFSGHFVKAGKRFGILCLNYPRVIFCIMVGLLLFSGALSFTVFRHPVKSSAAHPAMQDQQPNNLKSPHLLDAGFTRILGAGSALKRTLDLKERVETTLAKGRLTHADSIWLEHALDSLQHLQHQIQH
ncbi:hypothetical protein [Mucilaginibacter paludis]|uniref:Uncharacterized protein n=1 Tax=Mucilaginibacter paludis DSM 18603 TaxID=714943 RepID=H1Y3V5_9SPHI|nr:hypothetical protein [Mucilaginibacter paludis]EHQ30900.1 hypothetical protein Mucpa_6851 [Mucilaginibacter paludis DSM 18603]